MRAITSTTPDAPPRTTFSVIVSRLSIPGHPSEEYTVETELMSAVEGRYLRTVAMHIASQDGVEVARHENMGALLEALVDLEKS